ncbi:VCBS repeat-containing protein [Actinopolymorpha alba]|uniref:VCBS repeat-containing protein n=1 Tax=Actinopolymorpha alba TaxID=533267 RepID=UPI0012F6ACC6|nr:VCBS repeat-containing protein [Actinopolymorpha alba]
MGGTRALSAALSGLVLLVLPTTPAVAAGCGTHVVSDFDGDGRSELAVGVPGEGTPAGAGAGSVVIFSGTAHGLAPVRTIAQSSPGVPGAAGPGARFGANPVTGDFNGDNCADLAVLAPKDTRNQARGRVRAEGTLTVLYGSAGAGLSTAGSQLLNPTSLGLAARWNACAEGCDLSIARPVAGDFDGDGHDDLATAAASTTERGTVRLGIVVVPGGPHGLEPARAKVLEFGSAPLPVNAGPSTAVGSLAMGDADGDGFADLAFSFGPSDPRTDADHPRIGVLYGGPDGLGSGRATQIWDRDVPGVPGAESSQKLSTVAFGDFNGDLRDDLAFSHPEDNDRAGSVSVLYGSATGLTTAGAQQWTRNNPGVLGDSKFDDQLGATLAAGDFNADGDDELVMGAAGDQSISVLPGSRAGLTATGSVLWSQDSPAVPGMTEAEDRWGAGLATGWFGHGLGMDLVVGAPGENARAGAVTVFYGSTTGEVGLVKESARVFTQGTRGVPGAPETDDAFGAGLVH